MPMFLRTHIDPKHVAVISEDQHQLLPVLTDFYKDVMQSLWIEHVELFFLYRSKDIRTCTSHQRG